MKKMLLLLVVFLSSMARSEVILPSIFSDDMVIQQKKEITIWGKSTSKNEIVIVKLKDSKGKVVRQAKTQASEGQWQVEMQGLDATDSSYKLVIDGENRIEIGDILVGEVWLCSGQSNMQLVLQKSQRADKEIPKAEIPEMRFFSQQLNDSEEPLNDVKGGHWAKCRPNSAKWASAVGYFFGKHLHNQLQVPVGLVFAYQGGTKAEYWMSKEVLINNSELKPIWENYLEALKTYPERKSKWFEKKKQFKQEIKNAKKQGRKPPRLPWSLKWPPLGPETHKRPAALYNAMIHPLIPFSIRGVIWYQGEANSNKPFQYQVLFPSLINSWRDEWGYEFPFLFVQLPSFEGKPSSKFWPFMREAQYVTWKNVPETGMAVTIDIGDKKDVHPKNKKPVGDRLALIARAKVYGEEVVYRGPVFNKFERVNGQVIVNFNYVGEGLICRGENVKGFELAGVDREFFVAKAQIIGQNKIRLKSSKVEYPVAVRYGWEGYPEVNLYNSVGLPACPFRTDDWQSDLFSGN